MNERVQLSPGEYFHSLGEIAAAIPDGEERSEFVRAEKGTSQYTSALNTLVLEKHGIRYSPDEDRNEIDRFNEVSAALTELVSAPEGIEANLDLLSRWERRMKNLNDSIDEHIRTSTLAREPSTDLEASFLAYAVVVGSAFTLRDDLDHLTDKLEEDDDSDVSSYVSLTKFGRIGELGIKFGDLSLLDFVDPETMDEIESWQVYVFFSQACRAYMNKDNFAGKIASQNIDDINQDYPQILRRHTINASRYILSLVRADTNEVRGLKDDPNGKYRRKDKIGAIYLHDALRYMRLGIMKTLIEGDPEEKRKLKDVISEDLKDLSENNLLALFVGIDEYRDNFLDYYRKFRQMGIDEDDEFWLLLSEKIKRDLSPHLPSMDDLPSLVSGQELPEEIPTFKELGKIVGDTFSKSSIINYEINPEDVAFSHFIAPQKIEVHFNRNRPQQFIIDCSYESPEGDNISLAWLIDTKKEIFKWTFIEDTEESVMQNTRSALMVEAKTILMKIMEIAEEKHRVRKAKHSSPIQSPTLAKKNGEPRRSGSRRPETPEAIFASKLSTPTQIALREKSDEGKDEIRRVILIPDEPMGLMSSLSSSDSKTVLGRIKDFNDRGIGEFKMLRDKSNGRRFALRVNTGTPGGIRVILHEASSPNGKRHFKIISIGYRKDIYRKKR